MSAIFCLAPVVMAWVLCIHMWWMGCISEMGWKRHAPCMTWFARADGSREVTFRELQGWSPNMLAVAVGRFESLASGLDAQGRRVAVWAPPGGNPQDAELTLHVLNASVSAWSEFTGYSLPELEKLEMVVWNGGSPWSSSQFGLLFMDRFRTLWNADFSTASDLVRAVHITCHEAGHHWFGGVLQTLNHTKFFIEESTTSYAEVFCVSKVLPQVFGTVLSVERAVFPAFGDTRSIHVGAEFHAINNLATPEHAQDVVVSSSAAFYTKGAALLHMLESYAGASVHEVRPHACDSSSNSAMIATMPCIHCVECACCCCTRRNPAPLIVMRTL